MDLLSCSISAGESLRRVVRTGTRRSFSSSPGRVTNWKEKAAGKANQFCGKAIFLDSHPPQRRGEMQSRLSPLFRGVWGETTPWAPILRRGICVRDKICQRNRRMLWARLGHSEFGVNFFSISCGVPCTNPLCLKNLDKRKRRREGLRQAQEKIHKLCSKRCRIKYIPGVRLPGAITDTFDEVWKSAGNLKLSG